VGQEDLGGDGVVVDDLALGGAIRIDHLLQVGQRETAAPDLDDRHTLRLH
jgi:hypothetical protein